MPVVANIDDNNKYTTIRERLLNHGNDLPDEKRRIEHREFRNTLPFWQQSTTGESYLGLQLHCLALHFFISIRENRVEAQYAQ